VVEKFHQRDEALPADEDLRLGFMFLRSAIASERLFGEKYSKGTGIMTYPSM
jgi:hypothetical protein